MRKYAQNLFPNFDSYLQVWEKRMYVQSVLIDMVKNKTLKIQDLANQPNQFCRTLIEEIITGTMVQDLRQVSCAIPYELESYTVEIKPIFGDEIVYEVPHHQVGILPNKLPILEKELRRIKVGKSGTAKLPLKDAWIAMHRYGKGVRSARSGNLQSKLWRFEEVTHG